MEKQSVTYPVPVTVNYGLPVEIAVYVGRYHQFRCEVNSRNCKTKRRGTVKVVVELIPLDRVISDKEARQELDMLGFRPAELREMLALGKKYDEIERKYPDIKREHPVVALDSVWNKNRFGGCYVPCIIRLESRWVLYRRLIGNDYGEKTLFAAVRK